MKKTVKNILFDLPTAWEAEIEGFNAVVTSIDYDSREIKKGSLFVALSGKSFDGHAFIPEAISKGAVAVVGSQPLSLWEHLSVPYIHVADTRIALAWISASFYDFPAHEMVVIGVTGTDGKTTTANLIYQILRTNGIHAGMISTVNAQIGDEVLDTGFHVTTPEAPAIQGYLKKMVNADITHVVLETTSHGLAQDRVVGCEYDIGVVTNITHEHLDFHGDYKNYLAAKAKMLQMLANTRAKSSGEIRLSVLNKDDISFEPLNALIETKKVDYSLSSPADVWAENILQSSTGSIFQACGKDFKVDIETNLPGDYNISNCLAAIAATVLGLGIDPQIAAKGVAELKAVPGRMEKIELGQPFQAIVDFAHTPNALERSLETTRKMTNGRVIAVFGSAGLRDRQKRRMMAAVSARLADITILTAEDPRTESLDDILLEMENAAVKEGAILGENLFSVPDRGMAIEKALLLANDDDLVVSCGKGHEQSMCFGETEYLWDDRTAMRSALAKYLGIPGPEMPYLPTQDK